MNTEITTIIILEFISIILISMCIIVGTSPDRNEIKNKIKNKIKEIKILNPFENRIKEIKVLNSFIVKEKKEILESGLIHNGTSSAGREIKHILPLITRIK